MNIGDTAPAFALPATDGAQHGLDGRPGGRRVHLQPLPVRARPGTTACSTWRATTAGRARVLFVNPNDAERYPRDSFDAMKARVEEDGGWPAPYLRDESQEVARAYGAKTTPDVFVVDADGVLRYRGAPDPDYQDPAAGRSVASRRARRRARGARARPSGDGAGGLQREVVAVALGLAASVSWGLADFIGGVKTRTLDVLAVLVVSQGIALACSWCSRGRQRRRPASGGAALAAAGAGMAGVCGPRGALPGARGGRDGGSGAHRRARGGDPGGRGHRDRGPASAVVAAGIVVALAGVALAAREEAPEGGGARLAVGAGWPWAPRWGSGCSSSAWTLPATTGCSGRCCAHGLRASGLLLVAALITRPDLEAAKPHAAAIAAIGVLDLSANGLFALATTEGLVSVAAVCSSLYPVVTILLARAMLSERVRPSQQAGVALVMLGVVAIAAG